MAEISVEEFVQWGTRDEMIGIMIEVHRLDPGMPDEWKTEMLVEQQERHDWIGRIDPRSLPPKKMT